MAQRSARRGRENQGKSTVPSSTLWVIWTRPANSHTGQQQTIAASQAGQMAASDYAPRRSQSFPLPRGGRPQMDSGPHLAPTPCSTGSGRGRPQRPPKSASRKLACRYSGIPARRRPSTYLAASSVRRSHASVSARAFDRRIYGASQSSSAIAGRAFTCNSRRHTSGPPPWSRMISSPSAHVSRAPATYS